MNRIKKYLLAFLLLELLLAYTPAYAQTKPFNYADAGVDVQITKYLCTPNLNTTANSPANNSDLYTCINRLYKFALAIASVVGVFFIVVAGYVYIGSEGNAESIDKVKNILTSTITALVILSVGYIFLKAINPDLIQFHSIQPDNVVIPAPAPGQNLPPSAPGGTVGSTAPGLAQQLISMNGSTITIASSGSCTGNNPFVNLQAIAAGQPAQYDGSGTLCNQGTTGISPDMLRTLVAIANSRLPITVTSLTSGHHANATDPHYSGLAVDLVPQNLQNNGAAILQALISGGAQRVAVECNLNGASQFIIIYQPGLGLTSVDASRCTGQPNYHWHAQWSAGVGNLDSETN